MWNVEFRKKTTSHIRTLTPLVAAVMVAASTQASTLTKHAPHKPARVAQSTMPGAGVPGQGSAVDQPSMPGAGVPGQGPAAADQQGAGVPGQGAVPAGVVITLDQAVDTALNNNSTIALARERLRKAQEEIAQGYATALPQISASIADTYSSEKTVAAGGGASGGGVSLPGGGVIPTIVDQSGSSSTFVGGGGGGGSTIGGSTSTTAPSTTASPSTTNGTTTSPGSTTTSPGSTGSGTGATGTGTGQAAPGAQVEAFGGIPVRVAMIDETQPLPEVLQQYADAENATPSTVVDAHALKANATGGSGNGGSIGSHNNYAARLSISQNIDIFGIVPASLDVLRRTRDFYQIDLDRVANELALTVKNDYFTVLRDQSNVAADQEQVKSATENVRITTAKFNQGQAARYDVLTAETTLANDQQTLISAQNQLDIDSANLSNLLGISLDQTLSPTTPPLPPLDQPIDLKAAVDTAYKNRPELKQADNNIAIANRLVRLNGAGLLPSLSVSGQASHSGPSYPGVTQDNWSVTANLAIPIYDGGTTRSRVRSAQSDLRSQIITRDQLRQNVSLEVRQGYLNTLSARSSMTAAQAGVDQAVDAARLAEVRFHTGVGTFLDVINAEAQLATARTNLATAQFQYQTSLAQLTRAEGGR